MHSPQASKLFCVRPAITFLRLQSRISSKIKHKAPLRIGFFSLPRLDTKISISLETPRQEPNKTRNQTFFTFEIIANIFGNRILLWTRLVKIKIHAKFKPLGNSVKKHEA